MSGPLVSASAAFVAKNSRKPPYAIEQSLRFNNGDSAHLHRTPSSAGSQTTFTLSVWVKSSVPSSGSEYFYATHNGSRWNGILRRSGNYDFGVDESGGSAPKVVTNAKLRDPSAWYHLVMAYDTTQATSTDRVKIWINGALQSINTGAGSYPSQNHGSTFNRAAKHWIGALDDTASVYYTKDFYLAEYHLLDGTAVTDADDFGEYDESGVWRPIEYEGGNYGTTGFYLKFDPSATNGVGHDHSGNGNNWTPSGFDTTNSTASTYDVMSDTPTNNYATLNPLTNLYGGVASYAEGNLKVTQANGPITNSTIALESDTYWEVYVDQTGDTVAGWGIKATDDSTQSGNSISISPRGVYKNGTWVSGGTSGGGAAAIANGDTLGFAFTASTKSLAIYVNNTLEDTVTVSDTTRTYFASAWSGGGVTLIGTWNFGQRAFAYTPPTGFKALNTSNLSAPTVKDGSKNFNPVIYAPDGSSSFAVTGVGFQPDFVWIKSRNYAEDHQLNDAVRGATKGLQSNLTNAETTQTNGLTSFDSDGFTVGNLSDYNYNGDSIISWNWLAGGTGSSNTAGSITSTVSANPSAGFSIVSWTGTGNTETVGHGLGVTPSFYILKSRDNAEDWAAYFTVLDGSLDYIALNTTNAKSDSGLTAPTSTVIYRGTADANNEKMIAYCFAEVEGYSKFGTYTGNGSTDGPFVALPFAPAFVMTKNTVGTQDWQIRDNKRLGYNPADRTLAPNDSRSENGAASSYEIDLLSNGFKIRGGLAAINGSGNTIVFAAFAEHPFGGSGVSPATAR